MATFIVGVSVGGERGPRGGKRPEVRKEFWIDGVQDAGDAVREAERRMCTHLRFDARRAWPA